MIQTVSLAYEHSKYAKKSAGLLYLTITGAHITYTQLKSKKNVNENDSSFTSKKISQFFLHLRVLTQVEKKRQLRILSV